LKSERTAPSVPTSSTLCRVHTDAFSMPMKMFRAGVGNASWAASEVAASHATRLRSIWQSPVAGSVGFWLLRAKAYRLPVQIDSSCWGTKSGNSAR
jgi:hypothetical protein